MMQLIWPGAMVVQALHVVAELGVADLVDDGPKSATELAQATEADAASLGRLLRALTSLGVFAEDARGRFQQTELSGTLRRSSPQSMRPWAVLMGSPLFWKPFGELRQTIATGRPAFDRVHGQPFFDYLSTHPDDAAAFNAAMGSGMGIPDIVAAYDFSRFRRVVDVGGGHGALLHAVLTANPKARGVLQDLPGVVAGAERLRIGSMAERCEIVGGDFFDAVPEGGDAYLLKGIVHDWSDESALKILKNCRRAIRPNGVLLLLEVVLQPSSEPVHALMDLLMMTLLTGRERTEADFDAMLREAGFALGTVIPTAGSSIIEGRPV